MATTDLGARGRAPDTAGAAAEQAAEVASTASDAAGQVAQEAKQQAGNVVADVREQLSEVTDEVQAQGRQLVGDAKRQIHAQAESQTERIADALRRIGDQMSGMLEGRAPEGGPVRDYMETAASKASELATRVQQRGFDGIVSDAERFARRRPGIFLLGAAAAGVAVGRLLRGAKEDEGSPAGQQQAGALPSAAGMATTQPAAAVVTPPAPPSTSTVVTPPAPPLIRSTDPVLP